MATHSIGSIVARARAQDIEKYAGYKHLKDYGIVREKHEEEEKEKEKVNIELYVDHPSKSKYFINRCKVFTYTMKKLML